MSTRDGLVSFLATAAGCLAACMAAADPWADAVIEYAPLSAASGYDDPDEALGPPSGGGPSTPDNSSVVSLGTCSESDRGYLVLSFDDPVLDDPANPFGLDCIVYSNAFWVGGNSQRKFQEPALIEISEDVNGDGLANDPWYLIPGSRSYSYAAFPMVVEPAGISNASPNELVLAGNITNPNLLLDSDSSNDNIEYNWGYAEMSPTLVPYLDNYVRPDDPLSVGMTSRSGGGDAFDIQWAVDSAGQAAGIDRFHFIRLSAFVQRDMQQFLDASPEIDAVVDVAPEVDTDEDGILDVYEEEVAGTDPDRPESTMLPLEIPDIEGGSPSGAQLGTAHDALGDRITLYADEARTDTGRAYSVNVDIIEPSDPGGALPDEALVKSSAVRRFKASISDFVSAGIQKAELTIHYTASEITGLDEASLQPYRLVSGAYVQTGISDVTVNADANELTFRSRYPGLFLLASTAGAGDTGPAPPPAGAITLTADPAGQCVANPANTVQVASAAIMDTVGDVVRDGALITVTTDYGVIATADADAQQAGVQVATSGGAITFEVQPPTRVRQARFTATSVEGTATGSLDYAFIAGAPSRGVYLRMQEPVGTGPVSLGMTPGPPGVTDMYANTVADGAELTLTTSGATILSVDADTATPGFQVTTRNGYFSFTVETPALDGTFQVAIYADAAQSRLIGGGTYTPDEYVPLPMRARDLFVALFIAAALALRRGAATKTRGR